MDCVRAVSFRYIIVFLVSGLSCACSDPRLAATNYNVDTGGSSSPNFPREPAGLRLDLGTDYACGLHNGALSCSGALTWYFNCQVTNSCAANVDPTEFRFPVGNFNTPQSLFSAGVTQVAISYNEGYACAVVNGAVFCWGNNISGTVNLDNGKGPYGGVAVDPYSPRFYYPTPQPILGFPAAVKKLIVTPLYMACALTVAGDVYCWGSFAKTFSLTGNHNSGGNWGKTFLEKVASGVEDMAGNFLGPLCFLKAGELNCLLDPNAQTSLTTQLRRKVALPSSKIKLLFNGSDNICVIDNLNDGYCFGVAQFGLFSPSVADRYELRPFGNLKVKQFALSSINVCGLTLTNEVHCGGWFAGYNSTGPTRTCSFSSMCLTPVRVPLAEDPSWIYSDQSTLCYTKEGEFRCMGSDDFFKLGIGPSSPGRFDSPVSIGL